MFGWRMNVEPPKGDHPTLNDKEARQISLSGLLTRG